MKPERTVSGYKMLDVIAIPEDIPELDLKSGTEGAIVDIFPDGTLVVEAIDDEVYTIGMIDVRLEPEPHVVGRWHLGES